VTVGSGSESPTAFRRKVGEGWRAASGGFKSPAIVRSEKDCDQWTKRSEIFKSDRDWPVSISAIVKGPEDGEGEG